MKDNKKKKAQEFVKYWEGKGYEKGESQTFWNTLLRDLFDIEKQETFIEYEDRVVLDKSTGFIDAYIPSSKVMIEQKSADKELNKAIKQSDGSLLTPYQQAKKYIVDLPVSKHPRWVITCNFKEFNIYDMEKPSGEPEIIYLKDLPKEYYRLSFITDSENPHLKKELELSIKAGDIVGQIYDAFAKQYTDINNQHSIQSLNKLCVRLVFCLYAEDAGLFKHKNHFHDYIKGYSTRETRTALIELFKVLNTPEDQRNSLYYTDDVLEFPYVNGGLFADEDIEIPIINDEIRELLLAKASDEFNWSEISPTIFGAVFESTLNPETRRSGGMHYTSVENIHKVIDPLFLDELKAELEEIKQLKQANAISRRVQEFQNKISNLVFLDPACGSGNFLTETYICLRKLENEALKHEQLGILYNPIKVHIGQFLGIEINDFAVSVAQTALWIAEHQMMRETEEIFGKNFDFLPLHTNAGILEGNALTMDWNTVFAGDNIKYIMGNPPFNGARLMTSEQKADIGFVFGNIKGVGNLDYVSGWYKKCSDYMKGKKINSALVSTNSITQGEQVSILWKPLLEEGIVINFAYRTFRWDSEANIKAHVHCVIIGFSYSDEKQKVIYDNDRLVLVDNINPYLVDAPNILIDARTKPLCDVPKMDFGSMPNDGGFLSNYSAEDYKNIVKQYPSASKYFRKLVGAEEYINNIERYCIWLTTLNPSEIQKIKPIKDAIINVKRIREESKREATRKLANTPHLFGEIRQPETDYLLVPSTSSENRRYIPIGFMKPTIISNNANLLISDATMYHFGILESNVHMAWMRAIAGRLKSDYRYSAKIVYNNFPWPNPSPKQKQKIEQTAQAILDARCKYPDSSLADMYGEQMYLFPELLKAHQENDKAVMEAYGFDWHNMQESNCVSELMKLYLTKINGLM